MIYSWAGNSYLIKVWVEFVSEVYQLVEEKTVHAIVYRKHGGVMIHNLKENDKSVWKIKF